MLDPVGLTGLLVAAVRAEESRRPDRLFDDPFAERLAGDVGRALLARYLAAATHGRVPILEVRTKHFDDAIRRATDAGARQIVVLAAGMDARAYRLAWPDAVRLYELDRPEVLAAKASALGDAAPRCARVAIGADLAEPWADALLATGFDPRERTLWLVEGLLQYLAPEHVPPLVGAIAALSTSRSVILFDVPGRALLASPALEGTLAMMKELGAPWRFATDDPGALVAPHGFRADVVDAAVAGNRIGRWPFPAAPAHARGVPRSYLVEATKD